MKIEEDARGTSVKSEIKSFSCRKDGRGTFQALISNHVGNVKYRSIPKKDLTFCKTSSGMAVLTP